MNRDVLKGKLQEWNGRIKEAWGKLTLNNSVVTRGEQEKILGALRKMYGHLAQVEREYDKFESMIGEKFLLDTPRT